MKVKVLGSSASEGFPAIFCNCPACIKAWKLGGKNIRTRSQFFVNDDMLIDFGDDTYTHALRENINLSKLKFLLITHSHIDHYNPTIFHYRGSGFATVVYEEFLNVYTCPSVIQAYNEMVRGKPENAVMEKIIFNEVAEFIPVTVADYTIYPLAATHMANEKCYLYVVEKDGKRVLFGNDSGYFSEETFNYLKGIHLDIVILDCTHGMLLQGITNSHMSFTENLKVKERFLENGTADEKTVFISHHFTHNCGNTHEELCEQMEKHGFVVSYDGLEFEL